MTTSVVPTWPIRNERPLPTLQSCRVHPHYNPNNFANSTGAVVPTVLAVAVLSSSRLVVVVAVPIVPHTCSNQPALPPQHPTSVPTMLLPLVGLVIHMLLVVVFVLVHLDKTVLVVS